MQGKWVVHRKIKSMMNKKEWIVIEYGEPKQLRNLLIHNSQKKIAPKIM